MELMNRIVFIKLYGTKTGLEYLRFIVILMSYKFLLLEEQMTYQIPTLETERLTLRPPTEADIRPYQRMFRNKELTLFTTITPRLILNMIKWNDKKRSFCWIIADKSSDNLLGAIRINEYSLRSSCCDLGYELDFDYWGKGYMSEALGAVVNFAHNTMDFNRIEAYTFPGNPGSDGVLLKNGFRLEGVEREKMSFKGKKVDTRLFGRLKRDPLTS